MFLSYTDLKDLFKESSGIHVESLNFNTVSLFAQEQQPRSLFIPAFAESGELKEAIANGAVGALWEKGSEIPSYTPNHFPIFYTENLVSGIKAILELYINKLDREKNILESTKFLFLDKKRLIENKETYDIAVMTKKLNDILICKSVEGRE